VDEDMPVISIAPNDALLEKMKSNLKEVAARGGERFHAGLSANSLPFKGRIGVGMG
jgi:glucosamine 6-phosphate synthetase-like amidotransferase/phosphosugar isomerase protein